MENDIPVPSAILGAVLLVFCLVAEGGALAQSPPPSNETLTNAVPVQTRAGAASNNVVSYEFWIGTNVNGNLFHPLRPFQFGGTQTNPFDGSSQTNFDYNLSNFFTNTTIHLLPGTYQTLGGYSGWMAKPGWRILGSGVDVTILQHPAWQVTNHALIDNSFLITSLPPWVFSFCGNVDLEDFTADCNYQPSNYVTGDYAVINGISLAGASNTVRNVKIINLAACGRNLADYREVCAITINPDLGSLNNGNLIQSCTYSNFFGNFDCDSGAFFMQNSGSMLDNLVVQNGDNAIFACHVYGPGRIAGNQILNCSVFMHMDNHISYVTNVIVESNLVVNVANVLDLYNGTIRNILFRNNTVVLTNHPGHGKTVNNLVPLTSNGTPLANPRNITIINNTFSTASPADTNWYFAYTIGAVSLNVISNVISSPFTSLILKSTNVVFLGNVDANGNYLGINQTNVPTLYTVTYDGNGNTGGEVPTDFNNPYPAGSRVLVSGNTGGLALVDYVFGGWNTAADASGTNYIPGKPPMSFTITSNTLLYALWGLPVPDGLQIIK